MISDDQVRTVVEHATALGARAALGGFRADLDAETKGGADTVVDPGDVVTEADREAQRRVVECIREHTDAGVVVGEEGDGRETVPKDGLAWVVDPIDGTYNYVRGIPTWATCVAAVWDGETVAAVTDLPVVGDRYVFDGEVVRDGEQLTTSDRSTPETAAVAPIVVPPHGSRRHYADGLGRSLEYFGDVRRIGSAQVALALVASGSLEGVLTPAATNAWDTVGGVRMVRAAGGTVTDREGGTWTPESTGLVASNGVLHEQLLDAVGRMTSE
jgi:myo-inositol-1(or 4)-monophosphatase